MALKQKTQDYELLIRFNEDGKLGFQRQAITLVKDGEKTISAKLEDPVPLSLADLQTLVASWTDAVLYVPPVEEVAE